jgi:hypothetical protein
MIRVDEGDILNIAVTYENRVLTERGLFCGCIHLRRSETCEKKQFFLEKIVDGRLSRDFPARDSCASPKIKGHSFCLSLEHAVNETAYT